MKKTKTEKKFTSLFLVFFMIIGLVHMPVIPVQANTQVDGSRIVALAKSYEGRVPYVYGGTSLTSGCDCSGFICRIYEQFGINLWPCRTRLRNAGTNIGTDFSRAIPGDIVWFDGHVGIYAGMSNGNPMMVNEIGGNVCNVKYMRVSYCTAALRGIIHLSSVGGENTSNTVTFSGYSVGSVTQTNAVPRCRISYTGTRPSSVGLYLGQSSSSLGKVTSDNINHNKNPFDVWYDINSEARQTLSASRTYYYQFYAIVNGTEYKSTVNSFRTKDAASRVSFSNYSVGSITTNNAVPKCRVSYSGTRPSTVGIYVGTSASNLRKVASDYINHNKNPFDAWYNLRSEARMTLSRRTTYYYQFYAIVDGEEHKSSVMSFRTR